MRLRETPGPVCAVVHSLLLALTLTATARDWPYYQHDTARTGDTPAIANPSLLFFAWTAPTGYSTPLVLGNTVYATKNGQGTGTPTTISAFALANGALIWTYSGTFVFPTQAAVGGGFVVFGAASLLYVLDAATGTLRYTVPVLIDQTLGLMPTIVQDPITGAVTAYIANADGVAAVALGPTSGSTLWTQSGEFGGNSMPTVVGNSVVLAGPGQYYAIDRSTGAENHFHSGGIEGGGGTTVAYDATRSQFYVKEFYNDPTATLSAYHYANNSNITLLWQRTGLGIHEGGSVAIGANGNVYSAGETQIWELDPATGATLRVISGSFAAGMTPALSNAVLWVFSDSQNLAYDLGTIQLLQSFGGSRGSSSSAYDSPGALGDGYFLLDYGTIFGRPGFNVYAVPKVMAQSAFSRKTHGAAGTFDVPLPLSGNVGIECRSGGASNDYQMIVNFMTTVKVGSASVTSGTGSVSSFSVSGSHVTVNLTGVANVQILTVTLFNVDNGTQMGNTPVSMAVLVGDVDGNALVNGSDVSLTKAQVGEAVIGSNFREDVNANGTVSASDVALVKSKVGTALPP